MNEKVRKGLSIAMGLLAISNLMKPVNQALFPDSPTGFVFFGERLTGAPNAVAGVAFGLLLAAYAIGVWKKRKWVVPIAVAYAIYVPVNLVLFALDPPPGSGGFLFGLIYATVAIGVSAGGAIALRNARDELT